jgi:creatinine amidohydrolase
MVFWFQGRQCSALRKEMYGDAEGSHATPSEVSLAQFYHPQAIKHAQMAPKVAPRSDRFYDAADYRRRYPDGRIGSDPSLSSPEDGERLYNAAVTDMAELYRAFVAD